ncbi:hypothetical protein MJO28_003015 [Puccinia striiformis f. sp. tritici]|uniref:Uncharacterized protein n=1 Tax=Puccinia striiformis f. sp. tritici TaxID=168172 RepID=A0ACC0ERZ0_9BASI|nr:hypothetical protein MJO28_003015 [Puccinia striiformis f. sp. tritici]
MVVSHETDGDENEFDDILNRQLDHIQSTELTDQQIHALHIIVGPEILLAALKLLDLRAGMLTVKILVLESGQAMYEIQGNEAVYHVQLGLRHSCTCQTFIDGVMIKARQLVLIHPRRSIFASVPTSSRFESELDSARSRLKG